MIAAAYLAFEAFPINYRPIPIDGVMEASYPSSTTLLALGVMPTLAYQIARRSKSIQAKAATVAFVTAFSAFMVAGRLVSGVHWATDIVSDLAYVRVGSKWNCVCLLVGFYNRGIVGHAAGERKDASLVKPAFAADVGKRQAAPSARLSTVCRRRRV